MFPTKKKEIKEQIEELLEKGIVDPAFYPGKPQFSLWNERQEF